MLNHEQLKPYFEGMTAEEIAQAMEFIKLWYDAPPEAKQAIREYMDALVKCDTIGEALNYITNEEIRTKLYNQAVKMELLDKPTTKDKAKKATV